MTERKWNQVLLAAAVLLAVVSACWLWSRVIGRAPSSTPAAYPEVAATPSPPAGYPGETAVAWSPTGYPADPPVTTLPTPYPPAVSTPTPTHQPGPIVVVTAELYMPVVHGVPPTHTPTPTPTNTPTNTPVPTPTPTIDFAAVRQQLQASGFDLGFAKIGFHVGVGGNPTGLGDWMRRLDATGVPFFLKSADSAGPLFEAQEILRSSNVPHTLVYRRSGNEYDTPHYDLPAAEAARRHWELHRAAWPPELDPSLVWIETINEVDKSRAEWLGQFALETARLAMAGGFRWAAFGWSSGEPEISDWQTPSMLAFLRLAAANPDRVAIALHEYSYLTGDIAHDYPFKVGRFQYLYQICDQYGIGRPTVLITEWGWEYESVPAIDEALADIRWAAALYAPYPQLKGAALWYLGNGFGNIADQAQKLIEPVREYSLGNYFPIPLPPAEAPINPEQYRP